MCLLDIGLRGMGATNCARPARAAGDKACVRCRRYLRAKRRPPAHRGGGLRPVSRQADRFRLDAERARQPFYLESSSARRCRIHEVATYLSPLTVTCYCAEIRSNIRMRRVTKQLTKEASLLYRQQLVEFHWHVFLAERLLRAPR